jgi:sensor histidine kinase YesM
MLRSLINIFGYTVRKMDEFVTLEEELNYLQEYVSLQQIRYGSRFTFELSVPSEFRKIKVFKFCIQPLVENCFIHGVDKSLDPVLIKVQAAKNGNLLEICVADDGPGMTPERFQEIVHSLELDTYESSSQGHGVGVSSIHHRLQYAYGPRYGIRFARLNPGLAVYLTVPATETPTN